MEKMERMDSCLLTNSRCTLHHVLSGLSLLIHPPFSPHIHPLYTHWYWILETSIFSSLFIIYIQTHLYKQHNCICSAIYQSFLQIAIFFFLLQITLPHTTNKHSYNTHTHKHTNQNSLTNAQAHRIY